MKSITSILVNYSDSAGGAAIAAYRTHRSLLSNDVNSVMWVNKWQTGDWTVKSDPSLAHRITSRLRATTGRALPELFFRDAKNTYRSYNWLPSFRAIELNKSDADLVHLVWINNEMLSVKDLAKINKPKIVTLQDMWLFCGAEHYTENDRYKTGYLIGSAPGTFTGVDIDRWVWRRKRRAWQKPFQLVAISEWLATCIRSSSLLADWPVEVIPNPVDTSIWKPLERDVARRAFNLPEGKKIILFGAMGGTSDKRKGYVYLKEALCILADQRQDVHLVIYGQVQPEKPEKSLFPISYVGRLYDPVTMCLLNNAADVFVTPAIQEAFGQTASEAQACGTPVVAFADTGVADIVAHKKTGYLAPLADSQQLASGISWVLDIQDNPTNIDGLDRMRQCCRDRAVELFSYEVVGKQYKTLYDTVLQAKNH